MGPNIAQLSSDIKGAHRFLEIHKSCTAASSNTCEHTIVPLPGTIYPINYSIVQAAKFAQVCGKLADFLAQATASGDFR